MNNKFHQNSLDDIVLDRAMKRKYAYLLYKHASSWECRTGKRVAAFEAALELLHSHFPFPLTHVGHAMYLAEVLPQDHYVLQSYLQFETLRIRGDLLPTREELAMYVLDVLSQIASRLNQMPKQSRGWKQLKEMSVEVVKANELYKQLIPEESN